MAESSGRRETKKTQDLTSFIRALLEPPRLPEHLLDGPSGDEEESEAKQPRSTYLDYSEVSGSS